MQLERQYHKDVIKEEKRPALVRSFEVDRVAELEMDKWFADVCLLEQRYCIDPAYSVQDKLDELGKLIG